MKNPNGFGSVYKLSGNRRRPYIARKTVGFKENGQQVYHIIGYYAKRTEALTALVKYNEGAKVDQEVTNMTFSEVYEAMCRVNYEQKGRDTPEVTVTAYRHCKIIHNTVFSKLKTDDLQCVIDSIQSYTGKVKTRKMMVMLYKYAIGNDLIEKNYTANVRVPEEQVKEEMHSPLSNTELNMLWSHDSYMAKIILIMVYTGVRVGELLSIQRKDVSLEQRYMIGGSKTANGKNRVIPISKHILPFVKEFYDQGNTLLISNNGSAYSYSYFAALFKAFFKESIKTERRCHDTRHTTASLLDRYGANNLAIMKILGHSPKSLTGKVYIHKNLEDLVSAIDLLPKEF